MDLLDEAEYDERVRIQALADIDFIGADQQWVYKSRRFYTENIERYVRPLHGVLISLAGYLIVASIWEWSIALVFSQVLLGVYVLLIGYHQWVRAECNRNVEDATQRKAVLNDLIRDNISILNPYVGKVFGSEMEYVPDPIEKKSRTLIDMYVFSELDNLEFVFQKARFGLVFPEFSFRAVKIFIARAENEKFARRASQLVIKGRYNSDFQKLVNDLIHIGLYRRETSLSGALAS